MNKVIYRQDQTFLNTSSSQWAGSIPSNIQTPGPSGVHFTPPCGISLQKACTPQTLGLTNNSRANTTLKKKKTKMSYKD